MAEQQEPPPGPTDEIRVLVPRGEALCAAWLQALQPPEAARALRACEALLGCAGRSLTSGAAESAEEARRGRQQELEALRAACQQQAGEREAAQAAEHLRAVHTAAAQRRALQDELQAQRDQRAEAVASECRAQLDLMRRHAEERLAEARECQARAERRYDEERQRGRDQADRLSAEHAEALQGVVREQQQCLATLSGRAAPALMGRMGEHLVSRTVAGMSLGAMTDTSTTKGRGDALWECAERGLRCLVEVKYVQNPAGLHSKKDLAKFWQDLDAGVRSTRVNAGILVSLATRIAGTDRIHISMRAGTPVLQASRDPDDALSAVQLVELGFRAMAVVWDALQQQRRVLQASSSSGEAAGGPQQRSLERLLEVVMRATNEAASRVAALDRHILGVEKCAAGLQKEVAGLRAQREGLLRSLDLMREALPVAAPPPPAAAVASCGGALLAAAAGPAVVDAVRAYRAASRGRYPRTPECILKGAAPISGEGAQLLAQHPEAFEEAKAVVKAENRKRSRC